MNLVMVYMNGTRPQYYSIPPKYHDQNVECFRHIIPTYMLTVDQYLSWLDSLVFISTININYVLPVIVSVSMPSWSSHGHRNWVVASTADDKGLWPFWVPLVLSHWLLDRTDLLRQRLSDQASVPSVFMSFFRVSFHLTRVTCYPGFVVKNFWPGFRF